jgi:hypothetical protein
MKTAVISFGRMNPITSGHQKLVDKIISVARTERAKPLLFLSHSTDKKKNPLTYDQKIKFAQKAFGKIVQKSKSRTIIQVLEELQRKYDNIVLVVGSDRVKEMDLLVQRYNGKNYNYKSIKTVSAGERDPDAQDVSGMSASKLRALAAVGQYDQFKRGMPRKFNDKDTKAMYDAIRSGMSIKEEKLDEVLSLQQRMKKRLIMRRIKAKIKRGKRIAKYKLASRDKLEKRAMRHARKVLRKRLAGKQGVNYNKLPLASRANIDKRLASKKAVIKKIGKRLLPKVRKSEHERLSSVRKAKKESFNVYRLDNKFYDDEGFYQIVNELLVRIENEEINENAMNNLQKKSDKYRVSLDKLKDIYIEGKLEWNSDSDQTPEQYAFSCVNTYLANRLREALNGSAQRSAKDAIAREKRADRQRHDRMLDQARIQDAKKRSRNIKQTVRKKNAAT